MAQYWVTILCSKGTRQQVLKESKIKKLCAQSWIYWNPHLCYYHHIICQIPLLQHLAGIVIWLVGFENFLVWLLETRHGTFLSFQPHVAWMKVRWNLRIQTQNIILKKPYFSRVHILGEILSTVKKNQDRFFGGDRFLIFIYRFCKLKILRMKKRPMKHGMLQYDHMPNLERQGIFYLLMKSSFHHFLSILSLIL